MKCNTRSINAKKLSDTIYEQISSDIEVCIMYILKFKLHYGEKRITDFFTNMMIENAEIDKSHGDNRFKAMKQELHNCGIDYDEIRTNCLKKVHEQGYYCNSEE